MTRLAILLCLLVAGCTSAPAETTLAPNPSPIPAAPAALEGRVWLPPSNGNDRMETIIPIPGLVAGARVAAHVLLGATYAADLPVTAADVIVELRDAAGEVLASAQLTFDAASKELDAEVTNAGDGALIVLSYGGSDGRSMGDHVDYVIEATAP